MIPAHHRRSDHPPRSSRSRCARSAVCAPLSPSQARRVHRYGLDAVRFSRGFPGPAKPVFEGFVARRGGEHRRGLNAATCGSGQGRATSGIPDRRRMRLSSPPFAWPRRRDATRPRSASTAPGGRTRAGSSAASSVPMCPCDIAGLRADRDRPPAWAACPSAPARFRRGLSRAILARSRCRQPDIAQREDVVAARLAIAHATHANRGGTDFQIPPRSPAIYQTALRQQSLG